MPLSTKIDPRDKVPGCDAIIDLSDRVPSGPKLKMRDADVDKSGMFEGCKRWDCCHCDDSHEYWVGMVECGGVIVWTVSLDQGGPGAKGRGKDLQEATDRATKACALLRQLAELEALP